MLQQQQQQQQQKATQGTPSPAAPSESAREMMQAIAVASACYATLLAPPLASELVARGEASEARAADPAKAVSNSPEALATAKPPAPPSSPASPPPELATAAAVSRMDMDDCVAAVAAAVAGVVGLLI
jgi:hypothetical protein